MSTGISMLGIRGLAAVLWSHARGGGIVCGIVGFVYCDATRPADAVLLESMMDRLRHRGPDDAGAYVAPGVALGSRRLSIIDLDTGRQPLANEDESLVVVCNGEIYNYVELREELAAAGHQFRSRSDTEVIVHLYEELGADCVRRLRGMFAFALWDSRQRHLFVARDRLGIKPLYYADTEEGFLFGSEEKAILAAGNVSRAVDPEALGQLFSLGFLVAPTTMFRSIRQLPPGHSLVHANGRTSLHPYWDIEFPRRGEAGKIRRRDWAPELRERLDDAVRLHLRSDVPVGGWLSGGLDSSSVVALMASQLDGPIPVTTLSFEDPKIDEIRTQRTLLDFPQYNLAPRVPVCRRADFERLPEALWHFEDPTVSGLEIVRLLISEASAQDVKVVLTGEGADEIFGGYPWFRIHRILHPLSHLPLWIRRASRLAPRVLGRFAGASRLVIAGPEINAHRYRLHIGLRSEDAAARLLSPDLRRALPPSSECVWQPRLPAGFTRWHPFSQLQYFELKVRLPSFVLPLVDRGSMAVSLEARVPFLDHELVEWVAQIPPGVKMRRLEEKRVLREAMADVLPHEIAWRRKRGLHAPTRRWLKDPFPEFATSLLSDHALERTGYFDPAGVRRTLAEHRAGTVDRSYELMGVLAVQLWDELFVRQEGTDPRERTPFSSSTRAEGSVRSRLPASTT